MATSQFHSRPCPPSSRQIYLPTEIILRVVYFISTATYGHFRQWTLNACCLISHQWYSVAIQFLYGRPLIDSEFMFMRFVDTVCPPTRAQKSRLNLGSFVRDLCLLDNDSTESLTAILLDGVKESVEVFIAPNTPFSVDSLHALSKCRNLRFLNLALADPVPITALEKAVWGLEKLETLRLPYDSLDCLSTNIEADSTCGNMSWPASLHDILMGGAFSESILSTISWPPNLTSLELENCEDLSVDTLGALLSTPHLSRTLKSFTITERNDMLTPESINIIPALLPALEYLSVPGDLVKDSFFEKLAYMTTSWGLRTLALGDNYEALDLDFSTHWLLRALNGGLAKLRSVEFTSEFLDEMQIRDNKEIHAALLKRAGFKNNGRFPVGVSYC